MINGPPKVMGLTIDIYEYLIDMPSPLGGSLHSANALALDVSCKHWAKAIPLQSHCLVANVDPALREQISDIPQA